MNSSNALTAREKQYISEEWGSFFPMLYPVDKFFFAEIVGPFAVGVLLEQRSNKDRYYPMIVLINLAENKEYRSFPLCKRFLSITRRTNEIERRKKMQTVSDEMFFPLGEDIEMKVLLEIVEDSLETKGRLADLSLLVSLLCFCNYSKEYVKNYCEAWVNKQDIWVPDGKNHVKEAMNLYKESNELQTAIEDSIVRFKLSKCNRYEILI